MMRTTGYVTLLQNHRLRRRHGRALVALVLMACIVLVASHSTTAQPQTKPAGERRWALYVTLAPSRMSEIVPSDGAYAYGGYPDIDTLYKQQAVELDRGKREAVLHQIQQLLHERVRFGPIHQYIWPSGIGPRVEEAALMLIDPYPWSAPLEEVRLKPE